jgi:hypothetical protein
MPTLIGPDLGTTTIVAALWDTEWCEGLRVASRRNDREIPPELPSRAGQDPQRVHGLAPEVLGELAGGR